MRRAPLALPVALLAAAAAALGGAAVAATPGGGAPAAGGACSKAGEQTGGGPGITLRCEQSGGKLVWTKMTAGEPPPANGAGGSPADPGSSGASGTSGTSGGSGASGGTGRQGGAPTPGGPCPRAGQRAGGGAGVTLLCARSGGKLVWRRAPGGTPPASTTGGSSGTGQAGTTTAASTPSRSACPRPVRFTHDLIAPSSVRNVTPIGGQTASGGVIAVRSYVMPEPALDGQRLPLYAPTAMTLIGAAYYKPPDAPAAYKPEYALAFDAGCDVAVYLYHVKELMPRLAAVVGTKVSPTSAYQLVKPLKVAAGEEIAAYRLGFNSVAFDLWVDDKRVRNSFISPARYEKSNALHSVCPWALYTEPKRSAWLAKLGTQGGIVVPGTPCGTVRQGVAGTVQGQWFRNADRTSPVDVVTTEGTYMSQAMVTIEADGTVRLGGFWAPGYVLVSKGEPTWADPTQLRSGRHCYADSTRSVTLELVDALTLRAHVADGPCPATVEASAWRTYHR